ncbi:rod shape-determining protein, subunit C [Gottschalkia purinilytica]|uniref:Cell shape-determining protein MreC n=1 Tax=Gottschalkia purinilytica TaxID=1503 RepID=A0A0L0WDG1_GOTPU|nr:rod shape-determining protein MreC [Gottschalkia purinilytica]KNF09460.1 rod shape-determining protein, subunit C [Gottschalkia purinilytica]
MNIFRKFKGRMIVAFVTIILIVIIGLTSTGKLKITKLENILGNVITPVQKVAYSISKNVANGFSSVGDIFTLKEENTQLKKEVAKLKDKVIKYEDIIGRSDYLKEEAELKSKTNYNLVNSQIIGKDPGNWFEKFIIDKGSKDGIKKGDPVVKAVEIEKDNIVEGLVGRVTEVGDNWSKVVSIVDSSNSVSFTIVRNQNNGVAKEGSQGILSGYMFDTKADVSKGDKLLTSGLGGVFEKGIFIGEVIEIKKKSEDLLVHVKIKPSVDFNKLHEVFVITGKKH